MTARATRRPVRMSRRAALVLVALLALSPGAAGENAGAAGQAEGAASEAPPKMPVGYTGPGREPYISYFQGVWLYGQASATALRGQEPRNADIDGDWLVWEDAARGDIFLYSRTAGQGYYVTNDAAIQQRPRISDGVVVYEQVAERGRNQIYAYFIDTSETRRITNASAYARSPDIDGNIIAWIQDNRTDADLWIHDLANRTSWNAHESPDRDADPLVLDGTVYWRSYRFNLWDVVAYDVERAESFTITSDPAIQSAPFTNGRDLFTYTRANAGWTLQRYDPRQETLATTAVLVSDASPTSASGDNMIRLARDGDYSQLVVRNMTTGANNHITGNLVVIGNTLLDNRTAIAFVRTDNGASILQIDVSAFAFAKRPTLTIANPTSGAPWLRPIVMTGLLQAGPEFTEPASFTYRIDDNPPQVIPAGERWRVTLDPANFDAGTHTILVRASFREGPPVVASVSIVIPQAPSGVDVERAGSVYHAARVVDELNTYILTNPASWFLIPLLLILAILLAIRVWIYVKPRRRARTIEYVPPDEA